MEDLNLSTSDFASAISILYGKALCALAFSSSATDSLAAGYLPFQLPSNYIISRISRPGLCK